MATEHKNLENWTTLQDITPLGKKVKQKNANVLPSATTHTCPLFWLLLFLHKGESKALNRSTMLIWLKLHFSLILKY